jgi:AraC family transcriptional regulator
MLQVDIVDVRPKTVIMLEHRGPYEGISAKFDELWAWIEQNSVPAENAIGIYYDNPDHVPAAQLRSAACAELPDGYSVSAPGMPGKIGRIAGGRYATTRHVGTLESLEPVWSEFARHIEMLQDNKIRENDPAFEVYLTDSATTQPDQNITDLYMPIH